MASEVDLYIEQESCGGVDPVRLDETERPYVIFYAPSNTTQQFYLDEFGYRLSGKAKAAINNEEKEIAL